MNYNEFCKRQGCEHYIEWDFGYGQCISCKLQGESYDIEKLADECPYKKETLKNTEHEEVLGNSD